MVAVLNNPSEEPSNGRVKADAFSTTAVSFATRLPFNLEGGDFSQ